MAEMFFYTIIDLPIANLAYTSYVMGDCPVLFRALDWKKQIRIFKKYYTNVTSSVTFFLCATQHNKLADVWRNSIYR